MRRKELLAAIARVTRGGSGPHAPAIASLARWAGQPSTSSPPAGDARRHVSSSAAAAAAAAAAAPWPSARGPISRAHTPPAAWYTDPAMAAADTRAVFSRSWLVAGRSEQVANPGDFFTGAVLGLRFLCVRGDDGALRAFHNFCRHNAASVALGSGCQEQFQCPYHGWTYDSRGRLRKATRLAGIEDFSAKDYGLLPLRVEQWGPYVFVNASPAPPAASASGAAAAAAGALSLREMLADAGSRLDCFQDCRLRFVVRKEYHLACNWKARARLGRRAALVAVFCNNYLDGGYHVPFAHGDLAAGIDMSTYKTEVFARCSLQSTSSAAAGGGGDRLGAEAHYAFVWPNLMLNRYGPWLDVNVAVPTGPETCAVVFDYFIDPSHPRAADPAFVAESLEASERVQREDVALCEDVQLGLRSPAYVPGRYAPKVEGACFHYHQLLEEVYGGLREEGAEEGEQR